MDLPSSALWEEQQPVGAGDIEYDTERAGTFEPLCFVARGHIAVPGLITTRTGRLETVGGVWR